MTFTNLWRCLVFASLQLIPAGSIAQTAIATSQAGASWSNSNFAVASIRRSKPGGELSFGTTPDGYQARSTPLVWIILAAKLDLPEAYWRPSRVLGAPGWVGSDGFDINAKVGDEALPAFTASSDVQRDNLVKPLLASMLTDRCHLTAHIETRDSKAVGIKVTAPTIKLKQSGADNRSNQGVSFGEGAVMRPVHDGKRMYMEFWNTSMREFAEVMSGLGSEAQPVFVDQTNLTGKYDFKVYKRDEDEASPQSIEDPDPATRWDVAPLGLTLKTVKVSLPVVIVDHIEYPSQN